jgi:hypothetical protein
VEVGWRGGAVGIIEETGGASDAEEDDGGAKNAGVTRFVEWLAWVSCRCSGGADEPPKGGGIWCDGAADWIIMWEDAVLSVDGWALPTIGELDTPPMLTAPCIFVEIFSVKNTTYRPKCNTGLWAQIQKNDHLFYNR